MAKLKNGLKHVPPDARSVLEIDLGALRANWSKLRRRAAGAECSGVVKADAYGLGLEEVAGTLTNEGCRTFFVATLDEARRVRTVNPGAQIYVLDGLLPGAEAYYAGFNLAPVLSSVDEIKEWAAYCRATNFRLSAAIHVDTGMHRLGLPAQEFYSLATLDDGPLNHFSITLLMSHLSCADTPHHPMNVQQKTAFDQIRALRPNVRASLANSGGTFLGRDFLYDLVRPGIALYGGRAFETESNPMRPVVKLSARILQVQPALPGDRVGYGGSYTVTRPSRVATIACGYADGFLRALGGDDVRPGPAGYIGDYQVRVIGRVSMDLITLDVTDVPEDLAVRGAWVEVIGDRVTVDDLTDRAGTIGYELLSRLSRRVHRIYHDQNTA
ncbi:MAG: alanine racemase [Hyphomicrobiaceae bacterium]